MQRVLLRGILLTLLGIALPAAAQFDLPSASPSASMAGFDCWISDEGRFVTYYIRCVRDRHLPPPAGKVTEPEDERILSEIHRRFHAGASWEELDRLVKMNADVVNADFYSNIRIFSYPSEDSWQAGQPQRLVRMLCPDDGMCSVFVRPD